MTFAERYECDEEGFKYVSRLEAFHSRPLGQEIDRWILRIVRQSEAQTLLDYGCGAGHLIEFLHQHHGRHTWLHMVGVDTEDMVKHARRKKEAHWRSKQELYEEGPWPAQVTVCSHVLGHVDNPFYFVNVVLHKRTDGLLVLVVPSAEYRARKWLGNKIRGYKDDPTILHHFTKKQIELLVQAYWNVEVYEPLGARFLGAPECHGFVLSPV